MLRKRTQKQEPPEGSAILDSGSTPAPRTKKVRERGALFPAKLDSPYLQAWMANTSDAVVALSPDFRVLDLNPAANLALGMSSEEVVGQPCMQSLRCLNLNHMALC